METNLKSSLCRMKKVRLSIERSTVGHILTNMHCIITHRVSTSRIGAATTTVRVEKTAPLRSKTNQSRLSKQNQSRLSKQNQKPQQINVREKPMGKSRKDNPEKLANKAHKTKKKPHKHNTICVGHHYGQTNINNVNKTKQHQLELKIQIHKTNL